ncbi:hypothetical protein [Peijinzhouia sedimentorum]
MKINYQLMYVFLLILSGCGSPNTENERAEISNTIGIELEIKGTLVLELDSQTSLSGVSSFGYDQLSNTIYMYEFLNNRILTYSRSGELINQISMPKDGKDEIFGSYNTGLLMRGNIAYFNEPNKFRISIADLSEGILVTHRFQYDMDDVQFKFETGTGPFTLFSTPILFRENKLYFTANLFEGKFQTMKDLKVDETYKINSAYVYDIEKNELDAFLPRPNQLDNGYRGEGLKFKVSHTLNPLTNSIVYAIGAYDKLIEVKADGSITHHPIGSELTNDFAPFSTELKVMPREKWMEYEYTTAEVSNVLFDQYKKLYYVFIKKGQTSEAYLDPSTSGLRDYSLVVIDENFNFLGEKIIDAGYDPNYNLIFEDGLYILRKDLYNQNDDYMTFDQIEIVR